MRFSSKRDWTFPAIWLVILVIFGLVGWGIYFYEGKSEGIINLFLVWISIGLLFLLLLKTTYYTINDQELICHTMGFKKRIALENIKKISIQKGVYAGLKINTSWRGIIISYGKWSEILISPSDEKNFIDVLKSKCPNLMA